MVAIGLAVPCAFAAYSTTELAVESATQTLS
jgi:hypothetical protein